MSNIKLIHRNLLRTRSYAILNISGLGIGLACAFAVILWVNNELSYDRYLPDAERIYRLTFETTNSGTYLHFARCWEKWIWQMPGKFPQIEQLVRLAPYRHTAIKAGENKFYSDRIFATDTNFFRVFDIDLLEGNAETALNEPFTAVISSTLAKKCFGDNNPVNRIIFLSGEYDTKMVPFTIRGIMKDTPENSHIHFDIITSFERPEESPAWAYVYLLIRQNTSPDDILSQFPSFLGQVVPDDDQTTFIPHLQNITAIHLFSNKDREVETNGNITGIWLFSFIALLLLVISWVNYYNLNKTRMLALSKQVQIQRIMGSGKKIIIFQSLTESFICVISALLLAVLILVLLDKPVRSLLMINLLPVGFRELKSILIPGFVLVIISVIAGSLPLIMHLWGSQKSIAISMVNRQRTIPGLASYGILMTGQFCMSMILMIATITIHEQNSYMLSRSLGDMSSDILVFKKQNWEVRFKYNSFRSRALENPVVRDITATMEEPSGETLDAIAVESPGITDNKEENRLFVLAVEDNFLDFFNIPLIAGRDFSLFNPDRKGEDYILNETALKRLGWTTEEAIGQPFNIMFSTPDIFYGGAVVGVVKDFNFSTVRQEIKPYVLFQKPIFYLCFLVRVDHTRKAEAIGYLKNIWEEELPDYPFEFEFISDLFSTAYSRELTQGKMTGFFSLLAVLIICFGLIAVTSVFVARRSKEIGIRKVNGAKQVEIIAMLNKNFVVWLIIAFVIACPVALYGMNKWLQNFAYRIEPQLWVFVLSGLVILVVTLLTVCLQSWKASAANPVEALRYE